MSGGIGPGFELSLEDETGSVVAAGAHRDVNAEQPQRPSDLETQDQSTLLSLTFELLEHPTSASHRRSAAKARTRWRRTQPGSR